MVHPEAGRKGNLSGPIGGKSIVNRSMWGKGIVGGWDGDAGSFRPPNVTPAFPQCHPRLERGPIPFLSSYSSRPTLVIR